MAARRGGLGKGLDTLIPETVKSTSQEKTKIVEKVVEKIVEKPAEIKVKISQVGPNKDQPRKQFDEDALMELSDSIKQFGIIQPLVVQEKNGFSLTNFISSMFDSPSVIFLMLFYHIPLCSIFQDRFLAFPKASFSSSESVISHSPLTTSLI